MFFFFFLLFSPMDILFHWDCIVYTDCALLLFSLIGVVLSTQIMFFFITFLSNGYCIDYPDCVLLLSLQLVF